MKTRLQHLLLGLGVSCFAVTTSAQSLTKLIFTTNWLAQAEHGGFYQAQADGIYKKYGLDVDVRMGGPQVNVMQLLLAGQADLIMGYDLQTLSGIEQGLPIVTIAATFQKDPAVLIAHPGVKTLPELKSRTLLIGQASETTFWPWLKNKYGFTDTQKRPYAFSVQPFLANRNAAQQGYATSEPFSIEQGGIKPVVFLLADSGYPPYAETIVTLRQTLNTKNAALQRFVQASAEGWRSYLANPASGNALIKRANPEMSDELLAFGVAKMKQYGLVTGGDAAKRGIMTMTDQRWKATSDFMFSAGLLQAPIDYKMAYTLDIVNRVRVVP
jgi:NitT/TauT family transport system substrate-binding protein